MRLKEIKLKNIKDNIRIVEYVYNDNNAGDDNFFGMYKALVKDESKYSVLIRIMDSITSEGKHYIRIEVETGSAITKKLIYVSNCYQSYYTFEIDNTEEQIEKGKKVIEDIIQGIVRRYEEIINTYDNRLKYRIIKIEPANKIV